METTQTGAGRPGLCSAERPRRPESRPARLRTSSGESPAPGRGERGVPSSYQGDRLALATAHRACAEGLVPSPGLSLCVRACVCARGGEGVYPARMRQPLLVPGDQGNPPPQRPRGPGKPARTRTELPARAAGAGCQRGLPRVPARGRHGNRAGAAARATGKPGGCAHAPPKQGSPSAGTAGTKGPRGCEQSRRPGPAAPPDPGAAERAALSARRIKSSRPAWAP